MTFKVYACVHSDIEEKKIKGQYLQPMTQIGKPTSAGTDVELAKRFWQWSEDLVKEKGFAGDWAFKG